MSDNTTVRWLTYDDKFTKAGLWHQFSNVQFLVKEAYECGRVPVIPELCLADFHNFGYEVRGNLAKYIGWDEMKIVTYSGMEKSLDFALDIDRIRNEVGNSYRAVSAKQPADISLPDEARLIIKQVDHEMTKRHSGLWSLMSNSPKFNVVQDVPMTYSKNVRKIAGKIIEGIASSGRYAAVHVRRGDELHWTAEQTTPEAVARKLREIVPNGMPVYLLTNETAKTWYDSLEREYPVHFYRAFPELQKLICHTWISKLGRRLGLMAPDNFMLYAVELYLLSRADMPIYTYKGPGPHYLCEEDGFL